MTSLLDRPATSNPDAPGDRATGLLDILMSDLSTYRYVPQVAVTPSLARRLLDLNAKNNRNKKERKIGDYARDMSNNKWREKTGQVLKIATDGTLIDGQNRLHAIVKSGRTLKFDLCFGIDPEDITVVDAHSARTAADTIKAAGGGDLARVSPVVKHVIAWEMGYPKGPSGSSQATPMEMKERYQRESALFEAAAARGYDCGRRNVGTPAAMGVAYFVLVKAADDKGAVDDFYDQLVSGVYPIKDVSLHGPYKLREKLIQYRQAKLSRAEIIALVIRIWNRYNTLVGGRREQVERVQAVRSVDGEGLTNLNFPKPIKALKDQG